MLLGISLTLFTSCSKDWLDQKPNKALVVASTLKDLELLMDGVRSTGSSLGLGEIAVDSYYIPESVWQSYTSYYVGNAYTWTNSRPYIEVVDWNSGYASILNFNIVLEKLNEIEPIGSMEYTKWNEVKGNALYHRARRFFELAQVFAPPFNSASADKDLGIPLRTVSDINVKPTRANVADTYKKILEDLHSASLLLPSNAAYKTRGSKCSVFALLSRIYMSMNNYTDAYKYADSSLQINSALQDFNKLSTSSSYIGLFNQEVIQHTTGVDYSVLNTEYKLDPTFYTLYDNNDLRKIIFFEKFSDNSIGFKGNFSNNTPPFFGLTTSEMFLNRAECSARAGNTTAAMNDLNNLLVTRWITGKFIPLTASSASEALLKILVERKKELIRRGLRWIDLRRLNFDPKFAETITRTIGGQTYSLEPNSYKYTFPIPWDVIELSGIQQNPGW